MTSSCFKVNVDLLICVIYLLRALDFLDSPLSVTPAYLLAASVRFVEIRFLFNLQNGVDTFS